MRITTRAVFQMTPEGFEELERDSYEHDGPVALAGGGDSGSSEQSNKPWKKVQPQVLDAAQSLQSAAGQPNEYYPGQTVAGFTPWQQQGMEGAANYAGAMDPTIQNQLGAVNFGMTGGTIDPNQNSALGMAGGMYDQFSNYGQDPALMNAMGIAGQANSMVSDPYSDPTIAPWIQSAIRPLTQQYQEQVLPGIRDQAEMYGGAGSRTGLAEGVAGRGYMDAVGDVSANMYNNAFNRGLGQQMQAGQLMGSTYGQAAGNQLAAGGLYGSNYGQGLTAGTQMTSLAPGAMQAGMMPWQTLQGIGGQQQALNQAQLSSDQAAYDYNRDADFNRAQQYYATMAGTPWGTSAGSSDPGSTGILSGAAGGAAMGAAAGSIIPGVGTTWGAGIGAGLGALGSIWG